MGSGSELGLPGTMSGVGAIRRVIMMPIMAHLDIDPEVDRETFVVVDPSAANDPGEFARDHPPTRQNLDPPLVSGFLASEATAVTRPGRPR